MVKKEQPNTAVAEENDTESEQLEEESDNEQEDEAQSDAEQQEPESEDDNAYELDASDTSSSDASADEATDEHEEEEDVSTKSELITKKLQKQIKERYGQKKGKQLYIRFPTKLPADDEQLLAQTKNLSNLITQVHRPRQKHARFCLADFASQVDRDKALKDMRTAIKQNKAEFSKVIVDIPRTESEDFVENLIKQKLKNLESKKTARRLKRVAIVAKREANFTPTVIASNLPPRTSMLELRSAFPNAVDVQMRNRKAAITLPSTFEARKIQKKPPSVGGVLLKLYFDRKQITAAKKKHKGKKNLHKVESIKEENHAKKLENSTTIEEKPAQKENHTEKLKPAKVKKLENSTTIEEKPAQKENHTEKLKPTKVKKLENSTTIEEKPAQKENHTEKLKPAKDKKVKKLENNTLQTTIVKKQTKQTNEEGKAKKRLAEMSNEKKQKKAKKIKT